MLSARLQKILGDLRHNFTRNLLVVLSVCIGVVGVGTVTWSRSIILQSVSQGDTAAHVASAEFDTNPFGDSLVRLAQRQPGVQRAEGRARIIMHVRSGTGQWHDLWLYAFK